MITKDKLQHFLAGIVIFIITSILFGKILGLLLVVVAALGKEVYDKYEKGTGFNKEDLAYTIAGGLIGLILALIL